ncbi:unnamed protein product [Candida verbasci]|uniref:Pet117p n=1 Tax=Candida verbasci TaxID=1227364 RepID=A0A9W4TVF2_9ASCO|nr:unnamed protein product [Candida verbasci]
MSTASKITLGASILFAAGSFVFINYSQNLERQALRQGPIKDAKRQEMKKLEREKSKKQQFNELDHKQQNELREKYVKLQPLNSEIITAEENPGQESKK